MAATVTTRKALGQLVRRTGMRILPGSANPLRHKIGGHARYLAYKLWPAASEATRIYTASVIGAGFGGSLSIDALAASERYRITAVADLNRDALAAVKRAHPHVRTFTDYREMLAKSPADVTCVATLAPSHLGIARELVKHRVAGVLMEKPLATTTSDGRTLLDLLRDARIPVVVPHGLLQTEHVRRINARVRSGAIGRLKLIEIECTGWDLMNAGVHWFNFVVSLLDGDPVDFVMSACDTSSRTYRDGLQVETLSTTTAQTRGGVTIVLTTGDYVDISEPDKTVLFRLVGSQGLIEFYGWDPVYRIVNRSHPRGKLVKVKPAAAGGHQRYLDQLAADVDAGRVDHAGAERSLAALEISEAAYLSAEHRCAVPLPLAKFSPPSPSDWALGRPYGGRGGSRDGRRLPPLADSTLPGHVTVAGLSRKEAPRMIRFGIAGAGWRSQFYLRVARACPDRFQVTGLLVRDPEKARSLSEQFRVPVFGSFTDLDHTKPSFVVTSVPLGANTGLLRQLAEAGVPALSETPPASTLEELVAVWRLAENGARIQVAEQYWAQPLHAARLALVNSGKIGRVSQAQVSSAHGYHGISLMRRYLGIGFESPTISARSFSSRIVQSRTREGFAKGEQVAWSPQIIAHFEFGDRLGVFDFCDDQYFSYIRAQRVLVRGDRGEIIDDHAVYLQDFQTPIQVAFARQSAGIDGNLEGHHLKGIQAGEEWVYRNPLAPGELSDDEIAVGTCLLRMGDYVNGGDSFYSLAEACQDRYLHLLMEEALKAGAPTVATGQPWA